jgi:hypothetical protein
MTANQLHRAAPHREIRRPLHRKWQQPYLRNASLGLNGMLDTSLVGLMVSAVPVSIGRASAATTPRINANMLRA